MDEISGSWKPPYFAFQTFWTFMADLASKPLPPKIDRSLLKSKSGTDQSNLLLALRTFDLMDEDNRVRGANLAPIAQGVEEERAKALGDLVRLYYSKALDLSEQGGTEGQLHDAFRDDFGLTSADTRRKAVTFFLHAARKAGIELSQYFPSTRSGSGGPGASRQRRASGVKRKQNGGGSTAETPAVTQQQIATGEQRFISFGVAGRVTVNVDVKWLDLEDEVVTGLRKAIRDLEALGGAGSAPPDETSEEKP